MSFTDTALDVRDPGSYALFAHNATSYATSATVTSTTFAAGTGAVSGTVTDAGGTHHGLAYVGGFGVHRWLHQRKTAADGSYSIAGLATGTDYQVFLTPPVPPAALRTPTGTSTSATTTSHSTHRPRSVLPRVRPPPESTPPSSVTRDVGGCQSNPRLWKPLAHVAINADSGGNEGRSGQLPPSPSAARPSRSPDPRAYPGYPTACRRPRTSVHATSDIDISR